jgi:hypothetical protein
MARFMATSSSKIACDSRIKQRARLKRAVRRRHAFHAIQGPEQIDRGRPSRGQLIRDFEQPALELVTGRGAEFRGPKRQPHRRRDPDRRGAAHREGPDRLGHVAVICAVPIRDLGRESALIQ